MIEKNSKRLLELKFEENHLIKSKCLKLIVKKYIAIIIKHGTKKKKKKEQNEKEKLTVLVVDILQIMLTEKK